MNLNIFNRGKKRDNEDDQSTKYPRLKITKVDNTPMDIDNSGHHTSLTPSPSSPCPSPAYSISNYNNDFYNPQYYSQETAVMTVSSYASCASYASYAASQDDFEVSSSLKKMSIDSILEKSNDTHDNSYLKTHSVSGTTAKGMCIVAQSLDEFVPLVGKFFRLGEEIIILYEKAKHNKELCGFLLKRCNCAMAAVRDLDIRKAENMEFFSKRENYIMFVEFVECMRKMRKFVSRVSKLHKLVKYFMASSIEDDFTSLVAEFDGYMNSLNFSFMLQSRDELSKLSKMRDEIRQIKEAVFNALEIPDDKQSCQDFLKKMDLVTEKNIEFQTQNKNAETNSDELITIIEANEPLLDGKHFQKAATHSKRIEKRTSFKSCDEYCFKEFSSSSDQSQIEIRRQVNILKELKDSDHIIRFYGVAKEDSKYYLVTEWMEHGNLYEYYTTFRDNINLQTKIKFALDICRGVAYLHECKILHHDIQSANILINAHDKVRIANFGLSKKFSDITRNITHNLENIRYMAPEKLLLDNEEDNNGVKKKKVPYDSKCEIYSVGTLLWEIAELKKPHSDLDKADMLVSIRKRVSERYPLPFSSDIPCEWEYIVSRAMEYEPTWRLNISDICRDFYKLSKKYKYRSYDPTSQTYADIECIEDDDENVSIDDNQSPSPSYITIKILTVEDAIRAHKSKHGSRQLAWQSFKHHSSTNIEAKYWLGYYYYHDKEIPELQQIDKEERIKIAVEIFKETADKGNPSAQLRYGICLWQGEGIKANSFEALKYLKLAAGSENSTAMYIIGKAYWNGGNGIDQDKVQGAEYLKKAARHNHPKAREMCIANRIF